MISARCDNSGSYRRRAAPPNVDSGAWVTCRPMKKIDVATIEAARRG
jgi:hypothetical protein